MSISRYPDVSGRAPERRAHHRVLVGAPAWLVVDETRHEAECFDLSMGGAAILTSSPFTTGTIVVLELALGLDRGAVAIECEVVRAREGELGLRFRSLTRRALEAIVSLL